MLAEGDAKKGGGAQRRRGPVRFMQPQKRKSPEFFRSHALALKWRHPFRDFKSKGPLSASGRPLAPPFFSRALRPLSFPILSPSFFPDG